MELKVIQDTNTVPTGSKSSISLAANNQAANRPDPGEIRSLAEKLNRGASPAPSIPMAASPPGVGTKVDLYDTAKEGGPGTKAAEPHEPLLDLPYLRPLGLDITGQGINTVI